MRYNAYMLKKTVYFRTQEDLDKFNAIKNKAEWLQTQLNPELGFGLTNLAKAEAGVEMIPKGKITYGTITNGTTHTNFLNKKKGTR